MKPFQKPPPLRPGDKIGIAAPAAHLRGDQKVAFQRAIDLLRERGFQVHYHPSLPHRRHLYLAGRDEERAEEFLSLLLKEDIKAILFARGGYGSQRIIPLIAPRLSDLKAKIVLGYSDTTSLLQFLQEALGWVTFYGPHLLTPALWEGERRTWEGLIEAITSPSPLKSLPCEVLRGGEGRGRLVGGCLSCLVTTLGTGYQIRGEGRVIFLEDKGEAPYRIDRMITHLREARVFEGVKGVIFGTMPDCDDHQREGLLKEAILDALPRGDFPVLFGLPSGHGPINLTIPLGVEVMVDGERGEVIFLEGGVG